MEEARERLAAGWRSVELHWQDSCEVWDDAVRRSFEQQYWEDAAKTVTSALAQMEALEETISKIRRRIS
jgi:hypothetical protein